MTTISHSAAALLEKRVSVPISEVSDQALKSELVGLDRQGNRNGNFDLGDIFVLAESEPQYRLILDPILGYEPLAAEGVSAERKMISLSGGQSIASIKIVPHSDVPKAPPIVFGTGLFHSMAVYLPFAIALAKKSNRDVVLYDIPSVGASQLASGDTVSVRLFREALVKTVSAHFNRGEKMVLAAHSLGTVAMRGVYFEPSAEFVKNFDVERYVFIAPARAIGEAPRGMSHDMWFMRSSAMRRIFGGVLTPSFLSLFFGPNKNPRVRRLVEREAMRVSIPNFLSILHEMDTHRIIGNVVGRDKKVRLILPDDELIPDLGLTGRGVIRTKGPHSFLVDPRYIDGAVEAVRRAIEEPLANPTSPPTLMDVHAKFRPAVADLQAGYTEGKGVVELSIGPSFDIPALSIRGGLLAGGKFDSEGARFSADAFARIELRHPDWLFGLFSEVQKGVIVTKEPHLGPTLLKAGVFLNLWNIAHLYGGVDAKAAHTGLYDPNPSIRLIFSLF